MRVVVTGASGRLGAEVVHRLIREGQHEVSAWSGTVRGSRGGVELTPIDLTDHDAVGAALTAVDPDTIIHAGALSSAEAVYKDPLRGNAINVDATSRLAAWAAQGDRRILFTSTDLVFAGSRSWYREDDPAEPILEYGRTKREAESHVLRLPRGLVVRLSLLFGHSRAGIPDFFDRAMEALARGESRTFFEDEFRTPLDYRTAATILVRLIATDATGIVHVAGRERVSRFELMRRTSIARGIHPGLIRPGRRADVDLPEPRPADVSLDTTRLASLLPTLDRPSIEAAIMPASTQY
jgi:dTDP-4-dehydrorhamnose reductase